MGSIPTIELEGRSLTHREPMAEAQSTAQKITELSTWMVILGIVRLVCAIANYLIAGLEATRRNRSRSSVGWSSSRSIIPS